MLINNIKLKNFRGFSEQEFALKPGVNLFIGPNASGKTGVLEAISVSIGSFFLGIKGYDSRNIKPEDIRVVANSFDDVVSFEKQFPVEISSSGIVFDRELRWSRSLNNPQGRTTGQYASEIKKAAEEADERVRNGDSLILPLIAYYGNGRLWLEPKKDTVKNENNKELLSRFTGYANSIDPRCSPRELIRWLNRQERITFQEKKVPVLLENVKKAVTRCLEDAKSISFDPKREELVISFNNGTQLPFAFLSDGQRGVAAMVGDIAMRASQLNPQLGMNVLEKTPGVVLIDEVDLYLHPRWQRNILRDLSSTFPKIQFICTTHSPQVIGEISAESIINLDKNNNHPSQSFGLDSNTIIENIMGGKARTRKLSDAVEEIKNLILDENYSTAKKEILRVVKEMNGSDDELKRLETIVGNLEAMSDNK